MMLDNYAERIRFVRSLTKLSREAFEEKYGINRNTLKSWELGINQLTEKSASRVITALKNEGFSCTPEWLIFGIGLEPRPLNDSDKSLLSELNEQFKIIHEADYFKTNNHDAIVSMITDTSMHPNLGVGDYVGGIQTYALTLSDKILHFNCKSCIINLNCDVVTVRKIMLSKSGHIVLCPLNEKFEVEIIMLEQIKSVAEIIWHRSNNYKVMT